MHTGLAGQLRYLVFQNFLPVLVVAQLLFCFGFLAAEIGDKISSWSSSNKLVKVSKNGKIMAGKKTGKATVTVKLKSGKKASVSVKVQKSVVAATKITVKPSSISIKVGKTYKLKPEISPLTCIQKIRYASSNKKVASVSSSGVVKGKKKGTAKITVTCNGVKKVFTVKVK